MPDSPLRALGSFPSLQITPAVDDSDLVSLPVTFVAGAHGLQNHGGATIANPKLVLLWCGAPSLDRVKLEWFAKELLEYGYLSMLTYSGFQSGAFLGGFDGPVIPAGTVLDSAVRAAITAWLASHPNIPQPDGSTIYSAMLPDGVTVQFDGSTETSCAAFCAFHEAAMPLLYTVQPSTNCQSCNAGDPFAAACMVLAHEVAETQSDPTGQGWYETSTGMENADIVAWIPIKWGPWTVQGYSDVNGNNVLGAYTAPVTTTPAPTTTAPPTTQPPTTAPPQPFRPDPTTTSWLVWQDAVATYVASRYAAGDLADARAWQSQLAKYAPGIVSLVNAIASRGVIGRIGEAIEHWEHGLPATPPSVPS